MNCKLKIYNIVLLIGILSLSSCKKHPDDDTSVDMGYDYYPYAIGNWAIYDVDSINYNDNTTPTTIDTFSYQVKELYSDTFIDNEGRISYIIERYKRDNDSAQWDLNDIWYFTPTSSRIERIEENVRYEPFIFPVTQGVSWDLNIFNSYNIYDEWYRKDSDFDINLEYINVGKPYTSVDMLDTYDSTTTVFYEYSTQISYEFYKAIYAKDVGMVYKQMIFYYSDDVSSLPVSERVIYGVSYTQQLLSYGN